MDSAKSISHHCGLVLQEFRKRSGLSQEKLALEAGLDRTYISLLERGMRQPSVKTLLAISKILQVPAYEVVQVIEIAVQKSIDKKG